MAKGSSPSILILPDVTFQKYHDEDRPLPFEATPAKIRQELERRLPEARIDLAEGTAAVARLIGEAPILIADRLTVEMLEVAKRLQWVQFPGSGPDHFFKISGTTPDDFRRRKIKVLNSPGISRVPVAEHVLALALALSRGVHRAILQQLRHEWRIFCGEELRGKTCGIIGLGEIGSRVAELARAFGMRTIGSCRHPERRAGAADAVYGAEENERIIREADLLVLACPLTPETRGLMGKRQFQIMKPTAYFINISRGETVDEASLVNALKTGLIAGAGLDTFGPLDPSRHKLMEALSPTSELWDLGNVIITPNNAASTPHYYEYFADLVAENYRRAANGQPFISEVA
jgi:phosphoglycerate dehydrogenase-like enzyme